MSDACKYCPVAQCRVCIFNREAALHSAARTMETDADINFVQRLAHDLIECKLIMEWKKELEVAT